MPSEQSLAARDVSQEVVDDALEQGLDIRRLAAVKWAVANGRISDWR